MDFNEEIAKGKRFAFGRNWQKFLQVLDEQRIAEAEKSLTVFLGMEDIQGKRFLDIGSGSGLFSLAARRLGAEVFSFDYDHDSVACTRELKKRYYPSDDSWQISNGSVLDRAYMESLGKFDICYSWGVLHHTGALYQALYNAQLPLKENGFLYIAIYNDQGTVSCIWQVIKKAYCSGLAMRALLIPLFFSLFFLAGLFIDMFTLTDPIKRYREHKKQHRGMSLIHDWLDWLGGYPYEPATKTAVEAFYQNLKLALIRFKPPGIGFGNNEFLLQKESE